MLDSVKRQVPGGTICMGHDSKEPPQGPDYSAKDIIPREFTIYSDSPENHCDF